MKKKALTPQQLQELATASVRLKLKTVFSADKKWISEDLEEKIITTIRMESKYGIVDHSIIDPSSGYPISLIQTKVDRYTGSTDTRLALPSMEKKEELFYYWIDEIDPETYKYNPNEGVRLV